MPKGTSVLGLGAMWNRLVCGAVVLTCSAGAFAAEIDIVKRASDGKSFGGEITSVSKTEVVVTQSVGNKEDTIAANDIASIEWKGEPPTLNLARSNERSGNLAEAQAGYQEALQAVASGAPALKAEIEFRLARTAAKIAAKDPSQIQVALDGLRAFVNDHRDHFRLYEAQHLLGELALAADDTPAADAAFAVLEQAPWPDVQMAGKLGTAKSLLSQGDVAGAKSLFDTVASITPKNASEKARRLEGVLGQAECQQKSGNYDDAVKTLQTVVKETDAGDTRLLAEAYLRQGDCLAADGQRLKEAVIAYLHVDVVPTLAAHGDLHAEALYNLAKLWPAIGQPARAAEATDKLQQDYPESSWTKKLSSGS